ncbi:hypothetical protein CSUI_009033 [Cystoisospora suis]|uniref:Uncharacterized protein n=1 Tax=Cystoisospora suis TaxID=483139 RepID=A0A2C6KL91_9APIC|nr:hypothetical protein CSUI_009033 [Cystoisospora suis]
MGSAESRNSTQSEWSPSAGLIDTVTNARDPSRKETVYGFDGARDRSIANAYAQGDHKRERRVLRTSQGSSCACWVQLGGFDEAAGWLTAGIGRPVDLPSVTGHQDSLEGRRAADCQGSRILGDPRETIGPGTLRRELYERRKLRTHGQGEGDPPRKSTRTEGNHAC